MATEPTQFTSRQRNDLRTQLHSALQNLKTDWATDNWSDVFVPASHLQALNPDRMVVEGMRGAGKSFWTGVLANPALLKALSSQPLGTDLKDALHNLTHSYAIALDKPSESNFPSTNELPSLLNLPGVTPEIIWCTAILRLFEIDPSLGMPKSTDPYDLWSIPVAWAGENAGRVSRALELLDTRLTKNNETALVVFDALDRASHELTEVSRITAGLLRVMLNLRFAKGLRLKAFIREDVLAQAGASVVDGSKLLNSKVTLQWSQADLYGLAFYRIAQNSPAFRNQFSRIVGNSWSLVDTRYQSEAAEDPEKQKLLWRSLVGNYMGNAATKGHSYPYIYNHLSDGLGRVAPRTFLTALRGALDSAIRQYSEKPHVIYHDAIKDGVRDASTARVTELSDEYKWIDPALGCIKEQQKTVPIDKIELEKIWLKNNSSVLEAIEAMRDRALIPWRSGASDSERIEQLRTTLEQIGIVKSRQRDGIERIELPDIYRLAYKIGRHGGIPTQKKHERY